MTPPFQANPPLNPRTTSLLMPEGFLLFGLTVVLLRNPSLHALIALIYFSFVVMISALVSIELASVFAALVTLIELFTCTLVPAGDRAWLAGQVLFLWLALYGIHRFATRDLADEHALSEDLRESRREMTMTRKEKASLENQLVELGNQAALRQLLAQAIEQLVGLKDPVLVRQRLMELVRSFIPLGTVHVFTGRAPRDAMDQWVMEKNGPLLVTDAERDSRFQPLRPGNEVRSILAAPITTGDRRTGLIRLNGFEPQLYSARDLRVLESLSIQASLALENLELRERLRESAAYDALTGLYSMRFFRERLTEEILRGGRYRTGFCVLLIEVNQLHRYQETYGQAACDQIVTQAAKALQACRREFDFTARYRDGAFALILPQTTTAEASGMAQGLQRQMASEELRFSSEPSLHERVVLRIGIAAFPDEATTASQLLRLAEERLSI